jgi:hypothetical protein
LTGLLAPLAYLNRYKHVIISSSYSTNSNIIWGSSPDIDNLISFSGTKVIHDSFEKKRIQKIKFITDEVKTNNRSIILKVCYSSRNTAINCNQCEKCYRTILGLIINNANPNDYGFKVSSYLYNEVATFIGKGFYSEGEAYFWKELAEGILTNDTFY